MGLTDLSSFLGCFSLRTGTIIIGSLSIVEGGVITIFGGIFLWIPPVGISLLILGCIILITSSLLMHGTRKVSELDEKHLFLFFPHFLSAFP